MSRAKPPNIAAVIPLSGYSLRIRWRDHGEDIVRLGDLIGASPSLGSISDATVFAGVRVGEYGWTAAWSDDIELDASYLYRLARYQAGESLTPEDFRSWRTRHGLSQAKAAIALGISDRMVKYYESGSHLAPKTVMLACAGYDALKSSKAA